MDILANFSNMKVYCVLPLESAHRVDSNEYTQYTIINIKKRKSAKIISNTSMSAAMGFSFIRASRTSSK